MPRGLGTDGAPHTSLESVAPVKLDVGPTHQWVCSSLFLKHSYKHLSCTAVAISISITELELLIQEPVQGRRQLMVSDPA